MRSRRSRTAPGAVGSHTGGHRIPGAVRHSPCHAARSGTTAALPALIATPTRAAATTPVNNDLEGASDGHL